MAPKRFLFLALLAVLFTVSRCGDDEPASSFSYSINGTAQKASTVSGELRFETQYDHEGRALNISVLTGSSQWLSVAVANWDFQNPPANGILTGEYDATFDFENTDNPDPQTDCLTLEGGVALCPGGLVSYFDETNFYFSAFGDEPEGTVTITACNTSSRTLSGTFSAKVTSVDENSELLITGSFQNVKYWVVR
jgi:hypothetical protein